MLTQNGTEESFALYAMGEEMTAIEVVAQQIAYHVPFGFSKTRQHVCTQFVTNPTNVFLVLMSVVGTGAVNHQSSRTQAVPDGCYDVALTFGTLLDILQGPVVNGSLVLTEHPFARTRHIAEYEIERLAELSEILRTVIGHNHIVPTPL